jgi:ribonucleoside-diphosphate reductase alpha chain
MGMDLRGAAAGGSGEMNSPTGIRKRQHIEVFSQLHAARTPVWETVEWEDRTAEIKTPDGRVVFRATDLRFPKTWSQNCTALVAEKYFRHVPDPREVIISPDSPRGAKVRETSVQQMIDRVATTIARWGAELSYFAPTTSNGHKASFHAFRDELAYILLHQMAAFNSPVWFNVGTNSGVRRTEQCSACFINSVEDNMSSILSLKETEGWLYKGGSGSGVNYSPLRSSREGLSGGGFASGPVAFIASDDANAGAIKSGGTTRRAAKMAILNIDHGDVIEFIRCKAQGEKAAHALIDAGFDGDFRARWGAYQLVPFQNANHSVRVTDEFMQAVVRDEPWNLLSRDGKVIEEVSARTVWKEICIAAHFCGDPGLQFDTTINRWNTSPKSGRINSSNPCSEYMYLDDTACNLASLNLLKFLRADGSFDAETFTHVVDVMITAMEIIIDGAGYPTPRIEENSSRYRTLGLGYSNLGAYLMAQGIPYDSNEGRAHAAYITAILTGRAYARSAEIAEVMGPFDAYQVNADDMLRVMRKHLDCVDQVQESADTKVNGHGRDSTRALRNSAVDSWHRCVNLGQTHGYRNAQASVIAPAGTISFLMDCDTTGIEPDLSLVKTKKLVGGGTITIVNQQLVRALEWLKYTPEQITTISDYIVKNGSAVGAPNLREEHLQIFDTSFPEGKAGRHIRPKAHVLMMAAVQPFVSGAISKTVNVPASFTFDEIGEVYTDAWQRGLKAVALYRDGSKRTQPLQAAREVVVVASKEVSAPAPLPLQSRKKLPADVMTHRHKFNIAGHEGYIHVGLYADGKPGELFFKMSKEGSTVSGLADTIGVLTSLCLQYGVPLDVLVDKFSWTQFEPAGITENPEIRIAKSLVDYVFRWLGLQFLGAQQQLVVVDEAPTYKTVTTGLICGVCGNPAQRAGACVSCPTCGATSGCG